MFELTKRTSPTKMLRMLDQFRNELNGFDDIFERMSHFHGFPIFGELPTACFSPSLNFVEKKENYTATIELPGIPEKDISITLSEDQSFLILQGEKKQENKEEKDDYIVYERNFGSFRREITLPKDIDINSISANFKDGVLKLILPKKQIEEKEKKKISINIT